MKKNNLLKFSILFIIVLSIIIFSLGNKTFASDVQSVNFPIINIPHFDDDGFNYQISAITWFGAVIDMENYADVRIGYSDYYIYLRVNVFDRYLWYDETPIQPSTFYDLTEWDSITVYLDTFGNNGSTPRHSMFSFTRQLQDENDGLNRSVSYRGMNGGWEKINLYFSPYYTWSGTTNDNIEDRGYTIFFQIPIWEIGSNPPAERWGFAIEMTDRDDVEGSTFSRKSYPANFNRYASSTWGEISFGISEQSSYTIENPQTVVLRNGFNGISVIDGEVGGGENCGQEVAPNFFELWGSYNWSGTKIANVQNQGDVADFPCFSKYYITFPLDSLPVGKQAITATLTLYQAGQADGFPNEPPPDDANSLIQIMVVDQDWNESTLSWNNAPLPKENVSQSWVEPIEESEIGKPRTWNISHAAWEAYAEGDPLRLVIYSPDSYGPHGKYFYTSDAGDISLRPLLTVNLGNIDGGPTPGGPYPYPIATPTEPPTNVYITDFKGTSFPYSVRLSWETTTEIQLGLIGFNLYRNGVKINPEIIPAIEKDFSYYQYFDKNAEPGKIYNYFLQWIGFYGVIIEFNPIQAGRLPYPLWLPFMFKTTH